MGCFAKLIKVLVLSFAVIGFISVGGPEKTTQIFNNFMANSNFKFKHKEVNLGDFSNLGDEFEVDKTFNMFGYKGLLAEHSASGQKMIVLNSKNNILTEEDVKSDHIESDVKRIIRSQSRNTMVPSELSLVEQGSIRAYGKKVPYARFKVRFKKLPMGSLDGIVSVAEFEDGADKILISVNQDGRYSHLIAKEFFKKIN